MGIAERQGPLAGYRVVEVAGFGAAPFGSMMLADLGADVIRVDRVGAVPTRPATGPPVDILHRGRRSVALNLKHPDGVAALLALAEHADVLIEPFRPGVAERLGFGPETCQERNPRLIYARMTGWGQDGPNALRAGHDINFISVSGVAAAIGRADQPPTPPLNLVGDYAGGGMLLVTGVLAALLETARSGLGQVLDVAMLDGAALLSAAYYGSSDLGEWHADRGANLVDSGAHFYDYYETLDGHYIAVGPIEPKFYDQLLAALDLDPTELPDQLDRSSWPHMARIFAAVFRARTRHQWCELLEHTDVCFSPVLSFDDAPAHPHNRARGVFVEVAGAVQPAPAPRFSRSPLPPPRAAPHTGENTYEVLAELGYDAPQVDSLIAHGAAGACDPGEQWD